MTDNEKRFTAILNGENVSGTLSGDIREMLAYKHPDTLDFSSRTWRYSRQLSDIISKAAPQEYASLLERLYNAVGERLYNFIGAYELKDCGRLFFEPVVFEAMLKFCYDKKTKKQEIMRELIDRNNTALLELCARYEWLNNPRVRDEIIAYSAEKNRPECTAFLLEFKSRNFDLQAEQIKAEKKMQRELNADPFSVTELKKLWKYEKQTDGTIMITGYKGSALGVSVPARIGKAPVTAVGERAFSPNALRITRELALVRCRITKIIVPEGVRTIGEGAFGGAGACRAVKGFFNAFSDLREVVLPRSLEAFSSREAAENAPRIFVNCRLLTVKIPRTPYSEVFCQSQNVDFEFYNVEYKGE